MLYILYLVDLDASISNGFTSRFGAEISYEQLLQSHSQICHAWLDEGELDFENRLPDKLTSSRDSSAEILMGTSSMSFQLRTVSLGRQRSNDWAEVVGGNMKRVVEYKVTRDIADYTSGAQRLPGELADSTLVSE
jgi:hypothetical protein